MSNALAQKVTKDNIISLEGAQALATEIREGMKIVNEGYLAIVPSVAKLDHCKGFTPLGYPNMDKCVENEFGMSHGTLCGIRKIFKLYGSVSAENVYSIPDKYKVYGYTKLLLFATDATKFENAGINPLEVFTPDMTIKEMKSVLSKALEDKAQSQDKTAIDTEGAEVAESTETTATESTETTATESTEPTAKPIIDNMLAEVAQLAEMAKSQNIKAEKMVHFDALTATLKEIKKIMK